MTYTRSPLFPNSRSPAPDDASWAAALPANGAFKVAGVAGWIARRQMQKDPTLEPRVRRGVQQILGATLPDEDMQIVENRLLDAIEPSDFVTFLGVSDAQPLILDAAQKRRLDDLVGKLGNDDPGRKTRQAYEAALKSGRIRQR